MKILPRMFQSPTSEHVSLGNHYNLEAHLGQVLQAYKIDTVIDVGANKGQFGMRMRQSGFRGDIYSFEPVKSIYDSLLQCIADDKRWTAYNMALGSAAGELQMNVSESSDFSSLLEPNEFGAARFKGIKVIRKDKVTVRRLDEFIGQAIEIGKRRILLKIDSQGYDHQVFEGAKGILGNVCAVLSELSLIPIYHGIKNYLEMLDIYQQSGFKVSGIYPVSRNKKSLVLIEMDCVL